MGEMMSCRQMHTPASAFMYGNTRSLQMSTAALHAELLQHAGVINSTINVLYAAFFHAHTTIQNSEEEKKGQKPPQKTTQKWVLWGDFGGAAATLLTAQPDL